MRFTSFLRPFVEAPARDVVALDCTNSYNCFCLVCFERFVFEICRGRGNLQAVYKKNFSPGVLPVG